MVTKENFEEYALLYVDQELTKAEEEALLLFVEQHPEYQKELATFNASIATPDEQLQFIDKNSLYKEEKTKTVAFNIRRVYYAAASIIALLFLVFYTTTTKQTNNPIASKTPAKKVEHIKNNEVVTQQPDETIVKVVDTAKPHHTIQAPINVQTAERTKLVAINQMPVSNNYTVLENAAPALQEIATVDIPQYVATNIEGWDDNTTKNNNISSLFALTETTRNVSELGKLANKKIDHIKDVTTQLKGSDVVLQLGKKEIFIVKL